MNEGIPTVKEILDQVKSGEMTVEIAQAYLEEMFQQEFEDGYLASLEKVLV